jgi:hypothetical protein
MVYVLEEETICQAHVSGQSPDRNSLEGIKQTSLSACYSDMWIRRL